MPIYLKPSSVAKYAAQIFLVLCASAGLFISAPSAAIIVSAPLMKVTTGGFYVAALIDKVSALFVLTVALISLSVFLYSYEYMKDQKFFSRFHLLLFLFVVSMLFLILSPNLVFSMLGWDGLGVTSYLLVIYYNNNKSNGAGMVTALVNRLGDFMLIMAIALIISSYMDSIMLYKLCQNDTMMLIILTVGAFTKSAQIPFSAWLPAAMAAPTPVSSLVHSSTLVTAGVYLMIRHLEAVSASLGGVIFFVGGATMTMASVSAMNEKDMKKMVALSTLSQLGLMMMSVGMLWPLMAFMHLVIHAYFKALMFMSAGNMIHYNTNYQSLVKAGGFIFSTPVNMTIIMVSSMSLMGAPFAAAFFSKEPILEMSMTMQSSPLLVTLCLLSVFMTGAYSVRFIGMVMSFNSKNSPLYHIEEGLPMSLAPLLIMFGPAFLGGSFVSGALVWQPASFLYPAMVKYLIFFMVLLAYLLLIACDSASFFKGGEFSLFSMWSLAGFTSSLVNKVVHWSSKASLTHQSDPVNFSMGANLVTSGPLLASFIFNSMSASSLLSSFMMTVLVILLMK